MQEVLVGWTGMVAIFAVIGRTVYCCIKLYYSNEREKRMERFDRSLQVVNGTGDNSKFLDAPVLNGRIAEIAERTNNIHKFGEAVLNECETRGVISSERARYIRL